MPPKRQAFGRSILQARKQKKHKKRNKRATGSKIGNRLVHADLNLGAFHYDANYDYTLHPSVVIGKIMRVLQCPEI